MNRENAILVTREQVIHKIADDRIGLVTEFGHDTTNQSAAAAMPLEVDRAVRIARAVKFRPTLRSPGLLGPDLDELEFFLQFRIAHNLTAQRSATRRDHVNHRLHLSLGSTAS